ncbi:hypothetical protein HWV62_19 [Athelia sp. TMB]|nr:hypothetical protein HWV62_19 [Athelia sp. TMB]
MDNHGAALESDLTLLNSGDEIPMSKATKRKRVASPELTTGDEVKPKRKGKARRTTASSSMQQEIDTLINEKIAQKRAAMTVAADRLPAEKQRSPKKPKGRTRKVTAEEVQEGGERTNGETATPSPKKRKPRTPKPEPVYVIPDVERIETTFKGRYACMNTILRNKKPASEAVFCARTCRLDSLEKNGIEWVKDLGKKNLEDMLQIIQWNEDNNIRFMRLSSTVFPFASHMKHGYSLNDDPSIVELLERVGALANKYGHRITTHPGQFTQLGSPNPDVIASSIRELVYHDEMLSGLRLGRHTIKLRSHSPSSRDEIMLSGLRLGRHTIKLRSHSPSSRDEIVEEKETDADADAVCIVHGGGVYGDKAATLKRIKATIQELPAGVRKRLVLENDELCYTAEDLLPVCEELDVPLVFDYHHDNLNPSATLSPADIIARANAIFTRRGIRPKQHLSEPRPGAVSVMERRAHADRVETLPQDLPDDMGALSVIQAKDKEQAVLHLHRVYGLQAVTHASLRPPAHNITMHTNGRKSNKKAKKLRDAAKALENDEDAEENDPCEDEDIQVSVEDDEAGVSPAQTPGKRHQEGATRQSSSSARTLRVRSRASARGAAEPSANMEESDSSLQSPKILSSRSKTKRKKVEEDDDDDFLPVAN